MRAYLSLLQAVSATILATLSMFAYGAPCAGFVDVDDTSLFCPSVAWLKSRGVTHGCTDSAHYCPNDPVTRLQMAALLNRFGAPAEIVDSNNAVVGRPIWGTVYISVALDTLVTAQMVCIRDVHGVCAFDGKMQWAGAEGGGYLAYEGRDCAGTPYIEGGPLWGARPVAQLMNGGSPTLYWAGGPGFMTSLSSRGLAGYFCTNLSLPTIDVAYPIGGSIDLNATYPPPLTIR